MSPYRLLPERLRHDPWRWAYIVVLVAFSIANAVALWGFYTTSERLTRQEVADRQEAISEVEACYRSAASRIPLLAVLHAIEGNVQDIAAVGRLANQTRALIDATHDGAELERLLNVAERRLDRIVARSKRRLANVRAFTDLLASRTPAATKTGRVPECELRAQALGVRLELVGRNADGTPRVR